VKNAEKKGERKKPKPKFAKKKMWKREAKLQTPENSKK
jgi:hypothetical protein